MWMMFIVSCVFVFLSVVVGNQGGSFVFFGVVVMMDGIIIRKSDEKKELFLYCFVWVSNDQMKMLFVE